MHAPSRSMHAPSRSMHGPQNGCWRIANSELEAEGVRKAYQLAKG